MGKGQCSSYLRDSIRHETVSRGAHCSGSKGVWHPRFPESGKFTFNFRAQGANEAFVSASLWSWACWFTVRGSQTE